MNFWILNMGTFLKKEVRLESKQLLNHGNSCLHTDAIDISKSYILMSHRHVFTVTLISTQIMFRVIRVPEKKNILSVVLNFSWCALFYIKKFIKRKRCWYCNTKLWHLDSNARNRLVFVQLMIPSEITSNRADAKVFFGWANLSTWTFHRVKNGFKWSTPEKSHVNLLTWVAEVYLKSPESVTSFLSTSNSTSVKHRLFVFYICLPYRTPEDFSQPASVFPIFMFYKKRESHGK